jgi:hypothetical protein
VESVAIASTEPTNPSLREAISTLPTARRRLQEGQQVLPRRLDIECHLGARPLTLSSLIILLPSVQSA